LWLSVWRLAAGRQAKRIAVEALFGNQRFERFYEENLREWVWRLAARMPGEVTILLRRWRDGDSEARQELMPHVYPYLREVAANCLRRESPEHTLQPTALVHELYLRLLQQRKAEWSDRKHFYAFAAKMMRLILTDHARGANAEKRGGGAEILPLTDEIPWMDLHSEDIIDINRALDEMEGVDPRKVRLVELRYFLGCTVDECAELTGLSKATVERDMVLIRSWLYLRLRPKPEAPV
jgi:RNA polymerase sigma factor (TIGR02999 family)